MERYALVGFAIGAAVGYVVGFYMFIISANVPVGQ